MKRNTHNGGQATPECVYLARTRLVRWWRPSLTSLCLSVSVASDVQEEIRQMVETAGDEPLPLVRHQNSLREYVGMYEYRKELIELP